MKVPGIHAYDIRGEYCHAKVISLRHSSLLRFLLPSGIFCLAYSVLQNVSRAGHALVPRNSWDFYWQLIWHVNRFGNISSSLIIFVTSVATASTCSLDALTPLTDSKLESVATLALWHGTICQAVTRSLIFGVICDAPSRTLWRHQINTGKNAFRNT